MTRKTAKRLLTVLISVMTVLVAARLTLPFVLAGVIERRLESMGAAQATIGDVDISLLRGLLTLQSVLTRGTDDTRFEVAQASVNIAYWPLLKNRLEVESAHLRDAVLDVRRMQDGSWFIGGFGISQQERGQAETHGERLRGWEIGLTEAVLQNIVIRYQGPRLAREATLRQARLQGVSTWRQQAWSPLSMEASMSEARLSFAGSVQPFAPGLALAGRLEVTDLPLGLAPEVLQEPGFTLQGTLGAKADIEVRLPADAQTVNATVNGRLNAQDVSYSAGQLGIQAKNAIWEGQADATLAMAEQFLALDLQGVLDGQDARLGMPSVSLAGTAENLQWRGTIARDSSGEVRMQADLRATAPNLIDTDTDLNTLGSSELSVTGVRMANLWDFRADRLDASEFRLLEREQESDGTGLPANVLSADTLGIGQPRLENGRIVAQTLRLHSAHGFILRESSGRFEAMQLLSEALSGLKGRGMPKLSVANAELGKSQVVFRDRKVQPQSEIMIGSLQARAENVGTIPAQPASVHARGEFPRQSAGTGNPTFGLDGKMDLFNAELSADLRATLDDFRLPQVSPYSARFLGYAIQSGTLDAKADVRIIESALVVETTLFLRGLTLRDSGQDIDLIPLPVSLPEALAAMKDDKGTVTLEVPIQGNLADPELDMSALIGEALGEVLLNSSPTRNRSSPDRP